MKRLHNLLNKYRPKEQQLIRDYQTVFDLDNIPAAKRVLRDMLKVGHMLDSTYSGPGKESDMLIAEGERNFVLRLLHMLCLSPEEVITQVVEERESLLEVTDENVL